MALIWKPYIFNAAGHRKALAALFHSGVKAKLDPRKLCMVAADFAQMTSHNIDQIMELSQALLDYAPSSPSAWYFHAQFLRLSNKNDAALEACNKGLTIDPAHFELRMTKGKLLVELHKLEDAEEQLLSLYADAPDFAIVPLADCQLRLGKLQLVEDRNAQLASKGPLPTALLAINCLSAALRNDQARLSELQNERLISVERGVGDDALRSQLAASLRAHSALVEEPSSTSTVKGNQAFLNDLLGQDMLEALIGHIHNQVESYVERHADHPYIRAIDGPLNLTGWAVDLQDDGFQAPHCHPGGRLSGVYYVDVATPVSDDSTDGAIEFWRPPSDMVGDQEPKTHLVQPENGMMLIFPSYYYHSTLPHKGDHSRISIAFDVG